MTPDDELECKVDLEEYHELKSEIVANQTAARQITSLTLVVFAALLGALDKVQKSPALYWVPLVFIGLMLTHLRYSFLALRMGEYIRSDLTPRIRNKVGRPTRIMDWEDVSADGLRGVGILVKAAAYVVPLVGILVSMALAFPMVWGVWPLWLYYCGYLVCVGYCVWYGYVAISTRDRGKMLPGARESCMQRLVARCYGEYEPKIVERSRPSATLPDAEGN